MLYSWASKWHTSAFWRTCWRKRKTSQSGRTFGLEAESDRLMPLHWHSWLVISLHIDKEYFNNVAGHFENRLCLAAHCTLLCLIRCVTISRSELTHPPSMFAHFILCTKWQQYFTFKFQRDVSLSMRALTPSYLCLATKQLISEAAYREIVRTLLERRG